MSQALTFRAAALCSARTARTIFGRHPPAHNPRGSRYPGAAWNSGRSHFRGYMSLSHLGLSDKVVAAVEAYGYPSTTPIQDQAIPHVLARRDVLGIAQTGTGKTAAFVLPMLTMLEQGRARARMPRTLIVEPTRELAAQVEESFVKYGVKHKLNVALLIGGVSFGDQEAKITRGADVVI